MATVVYSETPWRRLPGLFLGAALLAAAPAYGQTEKWVRGDIVITADFSNFGYVGAHGYRGVGVAIQNRSATRSYRVRLTFASNFYNAREVPPGRTEHVPLLFPHMRFPGGDLEVAIDGKVQPKLVSVATPNSGDDRLVLLLSPTASRVLQELAARINRRLKGVAFNTERLQWVWTDRTVTDWPTQWLYYSRYDTIVVTSTDMHAMPAVVQAALRQYVECGGCLLVLGPWQVPAEWQRRRQVLDKDLVTWEGYDAGFGQCLISTEIDPWRWTPRQWRHLLGAWERTALPWRQRKTVAEAHRDFPVKGATSFPERGLFGALILFAVLIGPVNLYVLARKNRRIWMLWTVPAISLLASAGVLGFMLWSEGWGGHVRTEALTILDETSGRAATVGWTGYYAAVTPGDGLHFSRDTELTPLLGSYFLYAGDRAFRTIDWSGEQHLAVGWLTARVPAYFLIRKTEARPEHVTVTKAQDGSLTLTNSLGAPIRHFWVADSQGRIYTAADVPPGGQAVLKVQAEMIDSRRNPERLRQAFPMNWLDHYQALTEKPQDFLLPGCYIAALDASPFIEEGLRDAQDRAGRSVVYGIMKEP
jgi:hypothetical protein